MNLIMTRKKEVIRSLGLIELYKCRYNIFFKETMYKLRSMAHFTTFFILGLLVSLYVFLSYSNSNHIENQKYDFHPSCPCSRWMKRKTHVKKSLSYYYRLAPRLDVLRERFMRDSAVWESKGRVSEMF